MNNQHFHNTCITPQLVRHQCIKSYILIQKITMQHSNSKQVKYTNLVPVNFFPSWYKILLNTHRQVQISSSVHSHIHMTCTISIYYSPNFSESQIPVLTSYCRITGCYTSQHAVSETFIRKKSGHKPGERRRTCGHIFYIPSQIKSAPVSRTLRGTQK